ncbi:MAG: putative ABC transporter ATP-binding protein YxlF [Pelotomaculum sp. PtaU1.Bin035]|nr:MAG: putative ABC transporter ATP-binding protein YxlF [Pelotomaculum sp. PtaU1.Bin035]
MIEIQKVTKYYGKMKALNNLNFKVAKGEILGFLGPNGAGKSTTMNIITGYTPSTEGTVKVCGLDILEKPREVKKHIGYLPEHNPLYTNMTVMEFLGFICELKLVEKKQIKNHLIHIMEQVDVADAGNRLIKNLSRGYRQRVGIAQSLVGSPEVLILDEPTVGLDPKQMIETRELIKNLGKEHTILFSSHILSEVKAVCDRVVIINRGEIIAAGNLDQLSRKLRNGSGLRVAIAGPGDKIEKIIWGVEGVCSVEADDSRDNGAVSYVIKSGRDIDVRESLCFALVKAGYPILELQFLDMSLEDIFIQLVSDEKEVNR